MSEIPANVKLRGNATGKGFAVVSEALLSSRTMKFSELVRLLEHEGFRVVKEKGLDPH
jgi:hypothetical protein